MRRTIDVVHAKMIRPNSLASSLCISELQTRTTSLRLAKAQTRHGKTQACADMWPTLSQRVADIWLPLRHLLTVGQFSSCRLPYLTRGSIEVVTKVIPRCRWECTLALGQILDQITELPVLLLSPRHQHGVRQSTPPRHVEQFLGH